MHDMAKYAYVFTKLGKPVAQDIKHKIKLLDPEKPIPHHRPQIMSEIALQKFKITCKNTPKKAGYSSVHLSTITPSCSYARKLGN